MVSANRTRSLVAVGGTSLLTVVVSPTVPPAVAVFGGAVLLFGLRRALHADGHAFGSVAGYLLLVGLAVALLGHPHGHSVGLPAIAAGLLVVPTYRTVAGCGRLLDGSREELDGSHPVRRVLCWILARWLTGSRRLVPTGFGPPLVGTVLLLTLGLDGWLWLNGTTGPVPVAVAVVVGLLALPMALGERPLAPVVLPESERREGSDRRSGRRRVRALATGTRRLIGASMDRASTAIGGLLTVIRRRPDPEPVGSGSAEGKRAEPGRTDDGSDHGAPTCHNCGTEQQVGTVPVVPGWSEASTVFRCRDCHRDVSRTHPLPSTVPVDDPSVFAVNGERCRACGRTDALEPHPLVSLSGAGHPHPHNVVPLCDRCLERFDR